jgi:hypothetical protein
MFEREKAFIEANKDTLRAKYPNKELVVVDERIVGVYDDVGNAYRDAIRTYEPGHFMIQRVPERPEDDIVWLSPFVHARIF